MKVKELISKLQTLDKECSVVFISRVSKGKMHIPLSNVEYNKTWNEVQITSEYD